MQCSMLGSALHHQRQGGSVVLATLPGNPAWVNLAPSAGSAAGRSFISGRDAASAGPASCPGLSRGGSAVQCDACQQAQASWLLRRYHAKAKLHLLLQLQVAGLQQGACQRATQLCLGPLRAAFRQTCQLSYMTCNDRAAASPHLFGEDGGLPAGPLRQLDMLLVAALSTPCVSAGVTVIAPSGLSCACPADTPQAVGQASGDTSVCRHALAYRHVGVCLQAHGKELDRLLEAVLSGSPASSAAVHDFARSKEETAALAGGSRYVTCSSSTAGATDQQAGAACNSGGPNESVNGLKK